MALQDDDLLIVQQASTDKLFKLKVSDLPSGGGGSGDYVKLDDGGTRQTIVGGGGLTVESGNVGIGTISPQGKLDVRTSDPASDTNNIVLYNEGSNGFGASLVSSRALILGADYLNNSGASASYIAFEADTTERMRIDSDGNVGVGTTSPSNPLHVQKSAVSSAPSRTGAALYLENNSNCEIQFVGNSDNDCQLRFGTSNNSFKGALEYQLDVDALLAYTNGTERMHIDSSGNVGIGVIDPSTTLDVNGTATAKNFRETVFTISSSTAFVLTPGNGESQFVTLTGNSTPTAATWADGESLTLHIEAGSNTVNWGTIGVVWVGGSAPDLASSGYTVIQFWKAGGVIYGVLVGDV